LALRRGRRQDRIGEAMAYRALARAAARSQTRKPAEHYLAMAMRTAEARGARHEIAVTQLCEAEILIAQGDRAKALARLDQAESAFDTMKMNWHLGESHRLRELI
jgi:ATP/maltotriose-dependent transcriptional regulator MalT